MILVTEVITPVSWLQLPKIYDQEIFPVAKIFPLVTILPAILAVGALNGTTAPICIVAP